MLSGRVPSADMYGKKVTTSTVTFAVAKGEFDRSLYKVKPGKTRVVDLIVTEKGKNDEIIWTSSNPAVAKVNAKGVVTGVKYGTATITALGKNTGFVATCKVKVCNVKQVAFTFDDGPSKHTPKLLDFLKENEIKATFFVVAGRLNSYKGTVKRIVDEGHELGYHSYAHKIQTKLTTEQIKHNAQTYVDQAFKVLDPEKTTIVHNGDWLKPLNLQSMLHLMSQFNVARILERDDFHNRYTNGQSISLHEFIYPVLQAYDSVVIKADLEMGGNDQIFNLLAGRDEDFNREYEAARAEYFKRFDETVRQQENGSSETVA